MKLIYYKILIILLFFIFSCKNVETVNFYDNKKAEIYKKDKNGFYRVKLYYKNGTLRSECIYKDGRLWNINKYFTKSGKILDPGDFKDGSGKIKVYDYNIEDMIRLEGIVINGYKRGYWIYYIDENQKDSIYFHEKEPFDTYNW